MVSAVPCDYTVHIQQPRLIMVSVHIYVFAGMALHTAVGVLSEDICLTADMMLNAYIGFFVQIPEIVHHLLVGERAELFAFGCCCIPRSRITVCIFGSFNADNADVGDPQL